MSKDTRKTKIKKPNRFWFELELPEKLNDEKGEELAAKACIVLNRLGVEGGVPVWWNKKEKRYCFTLDVAGGYVVANDHGHWYNLDYIAKLCEKG